MHLRPALLRFALAGATGVGLLLPAAVTAGNVGAQAPAPAPSSGGSGCALGPGGAIKHVIYMQFDNTHFLRDNPNVPSDIEQMPALLHFMEGNGTVLPNDHTPLIAHTGNDLLTSETGVYPNEQGIADANSYQYYQPNGLTDTAGSFSYWTDPVDSFSTANGLGTDHNFNILDSKGQNTPAPWVPYTRAGCNVGEVALADLDLENSVPDVPLVFGKNSPEAKNAENPNFPTETEYQGLSVHCAKGATICAGNPGVVPDRLPDEPGGYQGYQAVFGAKFLDRDLSTTGKPTNLDGKVIKDSQGNIGFPGYDSMQPTNALAYTLDMQERGIPVTYTYLTDAHDNATTGAGMGPGEPTYEAQLKAYNKAFATFFAQAQAHGITRANTLFVFGEDENDHFVGSAPSPTNCNGVTVTCSYSQTGEVDANLQGLLASQEGITTPFAVHADSAPFIFLNNQPTRTNPTVRAFERGLARVTAPNPYTGKTAPLTNYLADPVELNVLHMVTADPARTPTVAMFANPDYFLFTSSKPCKGSACESFDSEAWNHGDIAPDINQSWMAFVGPGVRNLGVDNTWASQTDTRPTLLTLLGLHDDYASAGRVLTEMIQPKGLSGALADPVYTRLASVYTQLESPVGSFGLDTLTASTRGLASGSATDDRTYQSTERAIAFLGAVRDALGGRMLILLERASSGGGRVPPAQAERLIIQGEILLGAAHLLAHAPPG
ncbi:MAG: hypothetical protein J2P57_14875 [Acidimicrobiaceae bacterium]|nr:hypothetical protein [Acidimicrobiaceae bacterium]